MTFELFSELSLEERARLTELISPSVGNPTQERIKTIIDSYSAENQRVLLVAKISRQLAGCVGLDRRGDHSLAILHIAVSKEFQRQGIGKALINESVRRFSPRELVAETDDDAIDFYRRCDFVVLESFGNESNVRRYRVRRDLTI